MQSLKQTSRNSKLLTQCICREDVRILNERSPEKSREKLNRAAAKKTNQKKTMPPLCFSATQFQHSPTLFGSISENSSICRQRPLDGVTIGSRNLTVGFSPPKTFLLFFSFFFPSVQIFLFSFGGYYDNYN
ncbi:hypothetical protein CDAR_434771 [Caerostris darwini]|uniref:Uncharacterized protein n=1 Tax=Caerostris darwini TaxID=1538125 RepID=A0AAV4QD50_9ARAC|nr:hypothetical protein CDAR_434771 [Caerostris darwini]